MPDGLWRLGGKAYVLRIPGGESGHLSIALKDAGLIVDDRRKVWTQEHRVRDWGFRVGFALMIYSGPVFLLVFAPSPLIWGYIVPSGVGWVGYVKLRPPLTPKPRIV
jgi:hypothetical protein